MASKVKTHLINLPEKVRTSRLVKALEKAVQYESACGFDYFARLGDIVNLISPQLEWIPELFPEYTPHTFEGHITRLFRIADEVIGAKTYSKLNAMELFLIITGIFAHDWGMAIGGAEKRALLQGARKELEGEGFVLLQNEITLLEDFAGERNLSIEKTGDIPALIGEELAEYTRRTHAWRSAVRIRRFLNGFDTSVGEAAAFICEGHWLDLREIRRRHENRPIDIIINSEVRLAAIAIYVRSVDLFDLARDRTPTKLESFVSPLSKKSQTEWAKHRALNPVKSLHHGNKRQLLIQGAVNDPVIWAALRDQSRWVDEQFSGGLQFLLHHLSDYYPVDLDSQIAWDIKSIGFKPIDIRFEFNRKKVIQILGNELYGDDPYVFLRELLQNAIDATRIRAACEKKDRLTTNYIPIIHLNVLHGQDGDASITCTDGGIGLDEYVTKHYLAAIGESYHDSSDFLRLGAKVDLIARYGIGFLSCFTVANRVELRTRRYAPPGKKSDGLHVIIDGAENQFSILEDNDYMVFGTEVTVQVLGSKLKEGARARRFRTKGKLRVTDYIKRLAGFIEVPIIVRESGAETIILSPHFEENAIRTLKTTNMTVAKLDEATFRLRWQEECEKSPIHDAIDVLSISLKDDLYLKNCEGTLHFALLRSQYYWISNPDITANNRLSAVKPKERTSMGQAPWNSAKQSSASTHVSEPSTDRKLTNIFLDGIRVQGGMLKLNKTFGNNGWPGYVSYINIKPSASVRIVAARDRFAEDPHELAAQITGAFEAQILIPKIKKILTTSIETRLEALGRLMADFCLKSSNLADHIPILKCPLLVHDKTKDYTVSDNTSIDGEIFWCPPEYISDLFINSLLSDWAPAWFKRVPGLLWEGTEKIILFPSRISNEMELALQLSADVIEKACSLSTVRFMDSGTSNLGPHILRGLKLNSGIDQLKLREVINNGLANPSTLTATERRFLAINSSLSIATTILTNSAKWINGINYFSYGNHLYNIDHPITQWLLRCCCASIEETDIATNKDPAREEFKEALSSLNIHNWIIKKSSTEIDLPTRWNILSNSASKMPSLKAFRAPEFPRAKDYIPGTVEGDQESLSFGNEYKLPFMRSREVGKDWRDPKSPPPL